MQINDDHRDENEWMMPLLPDPEQDESALLLLLQGPHAHDEPTDNGRDREPDHEPHPEEDPYDECMASVDRDFYDFDDDTPLGLLQLQQPPPQQPPQPAAADHERAPSPVAVHVRQLTREQQAALDAIEAADWQREADAQARVEASCSCLDHGHEVAASCSAAAASTPPPPAEPTTQRHRRRRRRRSHSRSMRQRALLLTYLEEGIRRCLRLPPDAPHRDLFVHVLPVPLAESLYFHSGQLAWLMELGTRVLEHAERRRDRFKDEHERAFYRRAMYPYHPWSDLVPEDADSPDLAGYMGLFGIDDPYCCLESSSLARQTGRLLSRLIRVCPSHPTASPALCLALHQYDSSRDEYARYCREPIYINPAAVSLPDLPIDVYVAVQQWMHHYGGLTLDLTWLTAVIFVRVLRMQAALGRRDAHEHLTWIRSCCTTPTEIHFAALSATTPSSSRP